MQDSSRRSILAFTVAFATFQAAAGAAAGAEKKQLVTLDSRPGVSLDFLLVQPDKPVASVILIEGGPGNLKLSGTRVGQETGFLAASRNKFAAHGLVVALVDAPSDRKGKRGMPGPFRSSGKHLKDIDAVVAWLKRELALPVWLVGVSRGTQSAAHVAIHGREGTAGLALLSSMASVPDKSVPVPAMSLDRISGPTLVVAHERDGCRHTPPEGAEAIKRGLSNASKVEVRYFKGGRAVGKDPCKPRTHHTFYGIEKEVVAAIAEFVKANPGAPAKPAAAAAATAATPPYLSESQARETLVGNTMRYLNRRGQTFSVFFGADGSAVIKTDRNPDRAIQKKWWFKDQGVLCRTVGKDNREHCSKVAIGDDKSLMFFEPSGQLRYAATLLEGNQLPK